MCEFKVFLNGEKVFEDAIYLASNDGKVMLKSILGETKEFDGCQIAEVNVYTEKAVLVPRKQ